MTRRLMDALREWRVLRWLDDATRDVSHAFRTLGRTPGFAAVTLLTLGLGIGANTAIFSVVNGAILRPLGYPHPEQLMYLTTRYSERRGFWFAAPEYIEFRDINTSFAAVGAYGTDEVNLTAGERPLRVRAAVVDDHLVKTLGLQAAEGRVFSPGETDATAVAASASSTTATSETPAIVILSYELWQSAFGGQPIVGHSVVVNGSVSRGHRHHGARRRPDGLPPRDLAAARIGSD
jgi:putative ABC transport system permease protein